MTDQIDPNQRHNEKMAKKKAARRMQRKQRRFNR